MNCKASIVTLILSALFVGTAFGVNKLKLPDPPDNSLMIAGHYESFGIWYEDGNGGGVSIDKNEVELTDFQGMSTFGSASKCNYLFVRRRGSQPWSLVGDLSLPWEVPREGVIDIPVAFFYPKKIATDAEKKIQEWVNFAREDPQRLELGFSISSDAGSSALADPVSASTCCGGNLPDPQASFAPKAIRAYITEDSIGNYLGCSNYGMVIYINIKASGLLLLHEVGHALGLRHSSVKGNLLQDTESERGPALGLAQRVVGFLREQSVINQLGLRSGRPTISYSACLGESYEIYVSSSCDSFGSKGGESESFFSLYNIAARVGSVDCGLAGEGLAVDLVQKFDSLSPKNQGIVERAVLEAVVPFRGGINIGALRVAGILRGRNTKKVLMDVLAEDGFLLNAVERSELERAIDKLGIP